MDVVVIAASVQTVSIVLRQRNRVHFSPSTVQSPNLGQGH